MQPDKQIIFKENYRKQKKYIEELVSTKSNIELLGDSKSVKEILDLLKQKGYLKQFDFDKVDRNDYLTFTKTNTNIEGHCSICNKLNRSHSQFAFIKKENGSVYVGCYRASQHNPTNNKKWIGKLNSFEQNQNK